MNKSARPTTELINSTYQNILENVQAQSAGLLCVGLLNTETGEHLLSACNSANIEEEARCWMDVVKGLFYSQGIATPASFSSLKLTKQIYLQFQDQGMVGFNFGGNTQPGAVLVREMVALDQLFKKTRSLTDRLSPVDGGPSIIDLDGVAVKLDELGTGSAEQICRVPEVAIPLLKGLFGQAEIPNLNQLQQAFQLNIRRLQKAYIETDRVKTLCLRPRFLPGYVLMLVSNSDITTSGLSINQRDCVDDVLRQLITEVLAQGINTDVTLAEDDLTWQSIVQDLRELDKDDLIGLLEVGGFANHSLGDAGDVDGGAVILRCAECIYYYPNRKWCDLPELPVPVEPHWYCKLWKL